MKISCPLTLLIFVDFSYAVLLIEKKDEEGQSQVLSAALEVSANVNVIFSYCRADTTEL